MVAGAVLSAAGILTRSQMSWFLRRVVVWFLFPVFVFYNLMLHFTADGLLEMSGGFLGGFAIIFLQLFTGSLLSRVGSLWGQPPLDKSGRLAVTFHNYGFMCYPIIIGMLGYEKLPLGIAVTSACDSMFWSLGILLLSTPSVASGDNRFWSTAKGIEYKKIFSPPFVTLILTVIFIFSGGQQVVTADDLGILRYISDITLPAAIACIGAIFYFALRDQFKSEPPSITGEPAQLVGAPSSVAAPVPSAVPRRVAMVLFFRQVFWPLGGCIVLTLLFPEPSDLRTILYIHAVMPASIGIVFLGEAYGGDSRFLVIFSLISNVTAVFTIPVYLSWVM